MISRMPSKQQAEPTYGATCQGRRYLGSLKGSLGGGQVCDSWLQPLAFKFKTVNYKNWLYGS